MKREPGWQPDTTAYAPQRGFGFRGNAAVMTARWLAGVPGDPESRAFGMNQKAALADPPRQPGSAPHDRRDRGHQ